MAQRDTLVYFQLGSTLQTVFQNMYLAKGLIFCLFLAFESLAQDCQETEWSPCCLPCGKQINPFSYRTECNTFGQKVWRFQSCSNALSTWSTWEDCSTNVCNQEGVQTRKRVACQGTFEDYDSQSCLPDQDTCSKLEFEIDDKNYKIYLSI